MGAPRSSALALAVAAVLAGCSASPRQPPPLAPPVPDPGPPVRASLAWNGALAGRRVVLSPGHGLFYDPTQATWTTQRPDCWGLVEDRHTNEIAVDHLIPMLERAGALVLSCRERSRQEHEAVADDSDPPPAFAVTGTWIPGTVPGAGWAGGDDRFADASAVETATAVWTPVVPAPGLYPVSAWYRSGANRCSDALYRIRHGGGTTEVRVDQRRFGSRWFHLGTFFLAPGAGHGVELSNRSDDAGCVVVADAVRLGGGLGSIVRGASASGRPRWLECARMWTEFVGAPPSVYEFGLDDRTEDVTCRAHFADWMEDEWQGQGGAVYLSLHTNAAATPDTGTGTDTFVHDTAPSPGSAAFQDAVHARLIRDIRALWKPDWVDRGQKTANFGELRETDDMPAVLVEIAFHDTQTPDNDFLHEDEFRRDVARALLKGVVDTLAPGAPIPPLPPTHLRVQALAGGRMRVSWRAAADTLEPSAAAAGAVVYGSLDGRAFDNGREVSGATSVELGGFTPGTTCYFRVAATNAGGESLPGEVLCARARAAGTSPVLLVNGFDRLDRFVTRRRDENTGDYVRQHAEALAAGPDAWFDAASNEAVRDGDVNLLDYAAVDWILGEESTADETFDAEEQAVAAAYLGFGGRLLVSGSEIAWDLGPRGSPADQVFLSGVLRASFAADTPGAGIRTVEPAAGSIFDGLAPVSFDDGTHGTYDVDWPDVLVPQGGATACLHYAGGTGQAAGIVFDGGPGGERLVVLAFPLETVWDGPARAAVAERIMGFLLP